MKQVKTLEDLRKIREEQLIRQQTRDTSTPVAIVGMGTCGIAAGAREVLLTLMEEIEKRGLKVNVTQTGCIGMCEQEPLLDIQTTPSERVTYGRLSPEMVKKIVSEHLVNGRIVTEAAIARRVREE